MNGYDAWLTNDREREVNEACGEGEHEFGRNDGTCIHCGEESESFDPDRKAEMDQIMREMASQNLL